MDGTVYVFCFVFLSDASNYQKHIELSVTSLPFKLMFWFASHMLQRANVALVSTAFNITKDFHFKVFLKVEQAKESVKDGLFSCRRKNKQWIQ